MSQIVNNVNDITIGPWQVRAYHEQLGYDFKLGCFERIGFRFTKQMRPIVCSILDGPIMFRPMQPSMEIFFDQKEINVLNTIMSMGTAANIVTGTALTTQRTIGNTTASTVSDPVEWHIVKLSDASGPWTFTLFAENRELLDENGQGTDWEIYVAGNTNGDASVSPYTVGGSGSVALSDTKMGKFTFTAIPNSDLSEYTFNESSTPFTINGVDPIREADVRHGDIVALIGIAYIYGTEFDASGTIIPDANKQVVNCPIEDEEPLGLRMVHMFEGDRERKALVVNVWKAINSTGLDITSDPTSPREIISPARYMALNDKDNHPESPFFEWEIIDSLTDLEFDKLI